MLVVDVRNGLTRLRPEGLIDGGHQRAPDANVDEDSHRTDDAHHHCRECNREP